MRPIVVATALLAGLAGAGACDDQSSDGGAAAKRAAACALDPTGTFTFHVHNAGTAPILIDVGCGASLPVVLATAAGRLSIGPGGIDSCGSTCDQIYGGQVPASGICSDCGPGGARTLATDEVFDLDWDRRVYSAHPIDPICVPNTVGVCAFGTAVAPSTTQLGVLTICAAEQRRPTGGCAAPKPIEFTMDTTSAAGTIEVGP